MFKPEVQNFFVEVYENVINNNLSFQKSFLQTIFYIAPPSPKVIYCLEITNELKIYNANL